MPIIGSLDGTFGHGRSPQTQPAPGFTFFPRIGNRSTWTFTANGAFSFSGNDTYSVNTSAVTPPVGAGNVYVIVPNTTFLANVKLWAAGGGSGGNASVDRAVNIQGGGAGAVTGQVLFQSGQSYTVVASGAAYNNSSRSVTVRGGSGGGISGIFKGNAFVDSLTALEPVVLAGGGGGAAAHNDDGGNQWRFPGAGGGNLVSQLGEKTLLNYGSSIYQYNTNSVGQSLNTPKGATGQVLSGTDFGAGGQPQNVAREGGGGGGFRGGPAESGGTGYVSSDQEFVTSVSGLMSVPALYDDSNRDTAGDPGHPGKVIIYTDEYRLANITATGGTITDVPIPGSEFSYRYHTFDSNGRFTISSTTPTSVIDIFAVGAGGGSAGKSGAGGGSVTIRTNFPVPVTANYIVTVGQGGAASDSYATNGVGRIYGGYRGGDSAFFNNNLTARAFPDNYVRLIYSYGKQIRYISLSGDDSDGLTLATAFNSFESALTKNANNPDLIVFVVIQGTYDPIIPNSTVQTPINDNGLPRVFICAPGRVTINFTPIQGSSIPYAPMAVLENPYSAIYGATIVRNMVDTTDANKMAFFTNGPQNISARSRGNFYNCVFRENSNFWTFAWGLFIHPWVQENSQFKIENCTFFTKNNGGEIPNTNVTLVLLKNCIFNKLVTTNAIQTNCATNVTVGAKYVVTGVSDKGVYAGEYGWGVAITAPEKNAPLVAIVARGGGGAPLGIGYPSEEYLGGTGPGNNSNGQKLPYLQPEHQANVIYSSYGYPGGKTGSGSSAGGGGAGGPAFDAIGSDSAGGIGLEWPMDSNAYYGTGGSGNTARDISLQAPGSVGKGGGGNVPTPGNNGAVVVRYIIPGSYTPPTIPPIKNHIAYGGTIRVTANYVEHVFVSSGTFYVARPTNVKEFYYDVIVVGGGGGGAGRGWWYYGSSPNPGYPGQVKYYRFEGKASTQLGKVTVGAAGSGGYDYWDPRAGNPGSASSFEVGSDSLISPGGAGGNFGGYTPIASVLITNGLFSDNTQPYGGSGGRRLTTPAVPGWGSYGSGGFSAWPSGNHEAGSSGISGLVIIRYPVYPIS